MAGILREVVRMEKREKIRVAGAMTLSFDDRRGYKLVRFHCWDQPQPHCWGWTQLRLKAS